MQSTGVEPRADRAGFAFHDIRFGFWAGIGGVLTTLIVGGKTVWMVALIVGLVIGLLSGSNESIKTPQEGARYGAQPPSAGDERAAVECLTAIVQAYGGAA